MKLYTCTLCKFNVGAKTLDEKRLIPLQSLIHVKLKHFADYFLEYELKYVEMNDSFNV